jgi:hypothetical protein
MKLLKTDPVRRLASELPRGVSDARRIWGVEQAARRLLVGGVLPVWLGAGLADWYLHRRTHIQDTAGPLESATHLVMFAETGVPILLGLFCEVNAGVLASAYGAAAVHSGSAYFDQAYAEERRRVSPVEQHVHSLLEVCPLTAALLLTALHWDQALALTGQGKAEFGLRFKRRDPLSARARCSAPSRSSECCLMPRNCGAAGGPTRQWRRCRPRSCPLPKPCGSPRTAAPPVGAPRTNAARPARGPEGRYG